MRMYYLLLTSIAVVLLNGCSFNVPLLSAPKPLKEKVVEGEGRKKILILDVTGVISEREKAGGLLVRGSSSMVDLTREALKKAEEDDDLAAVIVRINSPGGTVTASDIIRHDIQAFKERKKVPVYACIMSIGVLLLKFNVEGLLEKVGVREQTIKSGDKKDILSPFRAATPEEQRLVQVVIDQLYQRFLDVIVARPHNTLSREELKLLADGRIYTASQALAAKLIDKTGYMDDVIADLKKQIGVEKARVVIYYRPGSYKGSIYAETPGESAELASLLGISGGADFVPASGFMYLWQP